MSEQQIASAALGDEDEIFGTVDAVEIEKQPMIDFGLVEDEKDAEFIQHEIEEIVEASVALEKYIEILDKARWDGVSKQTARTIMVGVKRIDERFGQRSALAISMEDETEGPQRIGSDMEQSKLSKDGLVGRAKEMWAKFVEFIKKAFAKAKDKVSKVMEHISGIKPKLAKLYEDFENWSPNGPNGGKKITLPAKVAAYTYFEGKYVDIEAVKALLMWIYDGSNAVIVDVAKKIRSLKGDENLLEVLEQLKFALPALPSNLPTNYDVTLEDDTLDFKFLGVAEEVEVQVRSKSEIRKYIKQAMDCTDAAGSRKDKNNAAFVASMEMLDSSFNLIDNGQESVEALRNIIQRLNKLRDVTLNLSIQLLQTTIKAYDVCTLERGGDIQPDEDEEYGMEGFGDSAKAGLKKLIEAFKAMIAKLKERWTKLMSSPEIMMAKTEAAKEKVKANKGAPPKAEEPEEETRAPEKMHTVFINGDMATAICEDGKLISPERYIPVAKYVIGTVGKQISPMIDKLIDGYNAGDLDAMRSVAEFDLPVFDDEIVNGWKLAYDADGTFKAEGEELNTTEITWPTFDEHMAMFASLETYNNTLSDLMREHNHIKMASKMEKFILQLTNDLLDKDSSEKIKVAMDSRVKLQRALDSCVMTCVWLSNQTFKFLSFSMKH